MLNLGLMSKLRAEINGKENQNPGKMQFISSIANTSGRARVAKDTVTLLSWPLVVRGFSWLSVGQDDTKSWCRVLRNLFSPPQ